MYPSPLKPTPQRVNPKFAHFDYAESVAVDGCLLDIAGIREFEHVEVFNVLNGECFRSHVIRARDCSGIVSINSTTAHKVGVGDFVIIDAGRPSGESMDVDHKTRMVAAVVTACATCSSGATHHAGAGDGGLARVA